jgi:tetratricopeptide (TPR) repeat protein
MRQRENLRTQLSEFLQALPEMQGNTLERQAFFRVQVGLEPELLTQINWEGSQRAVANDLVMHLMSGGREQLLCCCQKFDNDQICGPDQQAVIRRLIFTVGQLSEQEWEQECAQSRDYASLEEGAATLERGDYHQALSFLKKAVQEIPSREKRLAAKARFLQALALLGRKPPRDTSLTVRERVEELMSDAIKLDQRKVYLLTLASIKRDIYTSVPSSQLWEEVCKWQKQARNLPGTTYDDELLIYLKCCQPEIYYRIWLAKEV